MKRTYDYSFIQVDNSPNIPTMPTRSLRQTSATLAAHPYYATTYMTDATAGFSSAYTSKGSAQPTYHLVQRYLPDEDQELQSNMWLPSSTTSVAPERTLWTRSLAQYPTPLPPTRPPLAGLGISFGPPDSSNLILPHYTPDTLVQCPGQYSQPGDSTSPTLSRKRKASAMDEGDNLTTTEGPPRSSSDEQDEAAYSACPSNDYAAPSPQPSVLQYSDYSPYVPYSPTDELLMFINTTPVPDGMDDFPVNSPKYSPYQASPMVPHAFSADRDQGEDSRSPMVGIVVDVNYRTLAMSTQSPAMCINPSSIGGALKPQVKVEDCDMQIDSNVAMVAPDATSTTGSMYVSRMSTPDMDADFPEEALTAVVSLLTESVKREATEAGSVGNGNNLVSAPLPPQRVHQLRPQASPNVASPQPPTYPTRSGFGLGLHLAASMSHRVSAAIPTGVPVISAAAAAALRGPLVPITNQLAGQVHNRLPPLQNAHEGIELEDLRIRAERFRQMNPGCELDKDFLQAFAGRLNTAGEVIPEFRCFVKDCSQTNKRRDHILVHVGSHVEHRPFQCPQCGMRFLRKNECKRHMSSHGGFKPFVCTLCAPYQQKSFVRQDLLKRHMKVTHGVKPEHWPDRRRKVKSEQEDVEDSPAISEYAGGDDDEYIP